MFTWRFGRDPLWSELDSIHRKMDGLLGALSTTRSTGTGRLWSHARLFPPLNVTDTGTSYVVTAEIPGMKTDDLEIKIEGDTLTLKGERKPFELGENASYHRRERATGIFQRSLTLPGAVDSENVKASYRDGVLTVSLNKSAAVAPKQITVSSE